MSYNHNHTQSFSDEEFIALSKEATSLIDFMRKLGYCACAKVRSRNIVMNRIEQLKIDTSAWSTPITLKSLPEEEYFSQGVARNGHNMRERIRKHHLIEYKCAICGNTGEWNGKPLTLQIDHINGDHLDNRLENLRFLCPNCHSQTDTFAGRNISSTKENTNRLFKREHSAGKTCSKCGRPVCNSNKTGLCAECYIKERESARKCNLNKDELLKLVAKEGFSAVGRQYGVSERSVRKWCASFGYRYITDIKEYAKNNLSK